MTTLKGWFDITQKGTSGDMVYDILYDWKKDREELLTKLGVVTDKDITLGDSENKDVSI